MVNRVAYQMQQWIAEAFQHRSVHFNVASLNDQLDLFAGAASQVTNRAFQTRAGFGKGEHPNSMDIVLYRLAGMAKLPCVVDQILLEMIKLVFKVQQTLAVTDDHIRHTLRHSRRATQQRIALLLLHQQTKGAFDALAIPFSNR